MSKRSKGPVVDPEDEAALGTNQPGNAPTALAVREVLARGEARAGASSASSPSSDSTSSRS